VPKKKSAAGPEKVLESKYIFKGHVVNLRIDTIITGNGRRTTREVVEHGESIVVVPIDGKGNVLLVDQYRRALGKNLLEIPAGGIEKGESARVTVIREMQEETGFKPKKVVFLTGFYTSPGFTNEYLHLYLATDLVPSRLVAEDTADINVVTVPLGKVKEMILSGRIQDSKSIAGLLFVLEYLKKKSKS
jgi:ADP-ribose pyrophosphatase